MALKIRLARHGAKKRPFYWIVLADSRSPRDGRFIEKLGTYNPMVPHDSEQRLIVKEDRIKHWLSVGAQATDRVAKFLSDKGHMPARARAEQTKKPQPKAKAQERAKERAAAAAAADAGE